MQLFDEIESLMSSEAIEVCEEIKLITGNPTVSNTLIMLTALSDINVQKGLVSNQVSLISTVLAGVLTHDKMLDLQLLTHVSKKIGRIIFSQAKTDEKEYN